MNLPSKEHFSTLPLQDQVAQLISLPAKTRQELILSSPRSLDLARSLSSETFFYTLKEIGLTDAVGLLALASPEQLRDMMDLDCWRKDRLDGQRILSWLMFLDEAGSSKLAEWALHADVELLVWLVKRHFEVVRKADVEEDPDFNQSLYFTFDDQYLLRFAGDEEPILHLLLERLRVLDYRFYAHILEQSLFELETPLEEESLRWRSARLADRGYPDFDEARDVLRAIQPEAIRLEPHRRTALKPLKFAENERVIPPDHALLFLSGPDSLFRQAVASVSVEVLEQVSVELAYLTNHVVMAEACDTGELSEVRQCVELVHDMLNIGLSYAAEGGDDQANQLIEETKLYPFFQIGWGLTLRLHEQAQRLETQLQRVGLADWQSYVDTPFREAYVGAQRRTPAFFQGLQAPGEVLYRRFQSLADIQRVETLLDQIPHWFTIMHAWHLLPEGPAPEGVTLEALWSSAFVRWVGTQEVSVQPLSQADLVRFRDRLNETTLEEQIQVFQNLAARQLHLSAQAQMALTTLAAATQETLQELLAIRSDQIDVRFVSGVVVARADEG